MNNKVLKLQIRARRQANTWRSHIKVSHDHEPPEATACQRTMWLTSRHILGQDNTQWTRNVNPLINPNHLSCVQIGILRWAGGGCLSVKARHNAVVPTVSLSIMGNLGGAPLMFPLLHASSAQSGYYRRWGVWGPPPTRLSKLVCSVRLIQDVPVWNDTSCVCCFQ